ncbi:NmrA family NAD(P)-binding protein [Spirosoma validum]|uniref:NmrA family NAD(P)-binding protein n=1 Tax=Spirosoma validum TaxID=2771355 RepID=A0A927B9C5_9BACT|nr:NmrA family NAD(P)-binding protein [Spirosoma validum]MBD2757754.1 NmrA family NAD(P)-binding protein [Spirosoma validum]
MNITVTGSIGNVSRPLIQTLVASGHQVQVISSSPDRAVEIRALGATPLIGALEDEAFILNAFQASDAVYTMIPPHFHTPDYNRFVQNVGKNYARAISQARVQYVVNLSSVGSVLAGRPPLLGYQSLEAWLSALTDVHVLHLRPAGFYSNFYGSISMIHHQGILGNNVDGDVDLVMSHPDDIAEAAAEAFNTLSFQGSTAVNIISDQKTGHELAAVLGASIGRPDLRWVTLSDQLLLSALVQNGIQADVAQHYMVDMGIAIGQGLLDDYYQNSTEQVFGRRSFSEFATEFAKVYQTTVS